MCRLLLLVLLSLASWQAAAHTAGAGQGSVLSTYDAQDLTCGSAVSTVGSLGLEAADLGAAACGAAWHSSSAASPSSATMASTNSGRSSSSSSSIDNTNTNARQACVDFIPPNSASATGSALLAWEVQGAVAVWRSLAIFPSSPSCRSHPTVVFLREQRPSLPNSTCVPVLVSAQGKPLLNARLMLPEGVAKQQCSLSSLPPPNPEPTGCPKSPPLPGCSCLNAFIFQDRVFNGWSINCFGAGYLAVPALPNNTLALNMAYNFLRDFTVPLNVQSSLLSL